MLRLSNDLTVGGNTITHHREFTVFQFVIDPGLYLSLETFLGRALARGTMRYRIYRSHGRAYIALYDASTARPGCDGFGYICCVDEPVHSAWAEVLTFHGNISEEDQTMKAVVAVQITVSGTGHLAMDQMLAAVAALHAAVRQVDGESDQANYTVSNLEVDAGEGGPW